MSSALTKRPARHLSRPQPERPAVPIPPTKRHKGPIFSSASQNDSHAKTTHLTTKTLSLFPIIVTLFTFRSLSAIFSPINDCDEVFNYIEPFHTMLYQTGLQTWEYSPHYALRSFTFLSQLFPLSFVSSISGIESTYGKIGTYMFIRLMLALFSCFCQASLIRSVGLLFGEKSARTFLFLQLFASGFTHSAHGILPQSYCMNILMLVYSCWLSALSTQTLSPSYHKYATSDIYNRHELFFAQLYDTIVNNQAESSGLHEIVSDKHPDNNTNTNTNTSQINYQNNTNITSWTEQVLHAAPPTQQQIQQLITQTGTSMIPPPRPTLTHLVISALQFLPLPSTLPNQVSSDKFRDDKNYDRTDPDSTSHYNHPSNQSDVHQDQLHYYRAELQAVRDWTLMIVLITICGLIGWPFTLIFLLPIIFSFLDCYFHFTTTLCSFLCYIRELFISILFTYIIPITSLHNLFVRGNQRHPQWLLDVFFYQTKGIFRSCDTQFSTCATLSSSPSAQQLSASNSSDTAKINSNVNTTSRRMYIFAFFCVFTAVVGGIVTFVGIVVDAFYYNRTTLTFLNIALYNSNFSGGSDDSSQGQQLYGTEPPSYYLFNLILNFNIGVLLCIVFLIITLFMSCFVFFFGKYRLTHIITTLFPVTSDLHHTARTLIPAIPVNNPGSPSYPGNYSYGSFDNTIRRSDSNDGLESTQIDQTQTNPPTTPLLNSGQNIPNKTPSLTSSSVPPIQPHLHPMRLFIRHPPIFYRLYASLSRLNQQLIVLTPAMIWLTVMSIQPHKEERFLYIIYPAICLGATFGLEFTIDLLSYLYSLIRPWCCARITDEMQGSVDNEVVENLGCKCCVADFPFNYFSAIPPTFPGLVKNCNGAPLLTSKKGITQPLPFMTNTAIGSINHMENKTRKTTIFSILRTAIHYLFHIPTSSLTSLRYASHAHPVRKPYRPYNGMIYTCVFLVTFFYMTISVSRDLAVIYGYSAPGMTMFKFYANINSDEPVIPLIETNEKGKTILKNFSPGNAFHTKSASYHARSLGDQVEMLFDARTNNYKQIIASYVIPKKFSRGEWKGQSGVLGALSGGDSAPNPDPNSESNRKNEKLHSQITPSLLFSSFGDDPLRNRYIHPCFLRHLQEYLYISSALPSSSPSPYLKTIPKTTQHMDADQILQLYPHLASIGNHIDYFPSQIAACFDKYQQSQLQTPQKSQQSTAFAPDDDTGGLHDRIPLNVNNHLGSQPLNYQLFSLIQTTNGFYTPIPAKDQHKRPHLAHVELEDVNTGLKRVSPTVHHNKINSNLNPYDVINTNLTPIIPIPLVLNRTDADHIGKKNGGQTEMGKISLNEAKKVVEAATTIKLCVGNEWYRFSSSFFLPDALWVNLSHLEHIFKELPEDFIHFENLNKTNEKGSNPFQKSHEKHTLDHFSYFFDKHIAGSGVGTIVGGEMLLRPRVEIEYLPKFDFDGMLPQHFTTRTVTNPSSTRPVIIDPDDFNRGKQSDQHGDYTQNGNNNETGGRFFNHQTSQNVPNFNDLNQRDLSRFLPELEWCDYIVDSDLSVRNQQYINTLKQMKKTTNLTTPSTPDPNIENLEKTLLLDDNFLKEKLYRQSYNLISSLPILDPERSSSATRAFYLYSSWDKNKFLPYNLWARKK